MSYGSIGSYGPFIIPGTDAPFPPSPPPAPPPAPISPPAPPTPPNIPPYPPLVENSVTYTFSTIDPAWSTPYINAPPGANTEHPFIRKSGSTSSGGTGPTSGDGNGGFYYYTETSSPRVTGDQFTIGFNGAFCTNQGMMIHHIDFKYHAYGATMGVAYVRTNTLSTPNPPSPPPIGVSQYGSAGTFPDDAVWMTAGNKGNAAWLASIQKSEGRHAGHHSSGPACAKPKAKAKKARPPADVGDEEAQELETFVKPKAKSKGKSKAGRPGR